MSREEVQEDDGSVEELPEIIYSFIDLNREQLSVERERLELAKQQDAHAHSYAMKALDSQTQSQGQMLDIYDRARCRNTWMLFIIVCLLIGILLYALKNGHTEIVFEIIKLIGVGCGGLGVGYMIGFKKGRDVDSQETGD